MKTTVELPDELMLRIKRYATENNRKLNDTIADLIRRGIATSTSDSTAFDPGEPFRIKNREPLTADDIEAAIAAGRDEVR